MALNINGTTGISGVDASVSAPALTGTDSNTGISFPSADTIKFSTGGVERMQITNSGVTGTGISDGKVLNVVSKITSAFDSSATNSALTSTPEAIIDGFQQEIQVTQASSKILINIAGIAIVPTRLGPARAACGVGFLSSDNSGESKSASDYAFPSGDIWTGRRSFDSSTPDGGMGGGISVVYLHTHGQSVGKYLYYTLGARDIYGGNTNGDYIYMGAGTITLMEIAP